MRGQRARAMSLALIITTNPDTGAQPHILNKKNKKNWLEQKYFAFDVCRCAKIYIYINNIYKKTLMYINRYYDYKIVFFCCARLTQWHVGKLPGRRASNYRDLLIRCTARITSFLYCVCGALKTARKSPDVLRVSHTEIYIYKMLIVSIYEGGFPRVCCVQHSLQARLKNI